jgi:regulator of nucleoside diphosphate kinase
MTNRSVLLTETDVDRLRGLVHNKHTRFSYGPLATQLEQELARGEVVDPQHVPKGVVTMNSRVRIRDQKTRKEETITLVYPEEADINDGRVSVLAPLGTALLGARVGDVVEVHAPAGVRRIKVEKILYQPEAAGDYHL